MEEVERLFELARWSNANILLLGSAIVLIFLLGIFAGIAASWIFSALKPKGFGAGPSYPSSSQEMEFATIDPSKVRKHSKITGYCDEINDSNSI